MKAIPNPETQTGRERNIILKYSSSFHILKYRFCNFNDLKQPFDVMIAFTTIITLLDIKRVTKNQLQFECVTVIKNYFGTQTFVLCVELIKSS